MKGFIKVLRKGDNRNTQKVQCIKLGDPLGVWGKKGRKDSACSSLRD